jgi:hypothetical protein
MWGRKCKSGAHARCLVTLEGHAGSRAVAVGDKQQVMINTSVCPNSNSARTRICRVGVRILKLAYAGNFGATCSGV